MNYNNMNGIERNDNNILKIIIGILIVAVVALVGYIIATSLFKDDSLPSDNNSNIQENDNVNNSNNNDDDNVVDNDKVNDESSNNNDDSNSNNNNSNDNNSVTTTSTDWKKYEVTINNKIISLPTSYTELTNASGFSYKEADLNSKLQNGYYTYLNMYKNGKLALYVEILNDNGSEKAYTECDITRISQTKYQVTQGADVVVFPGGLKAGDTITEAKIIELFGEPDETKDYTSDNYVSKTYLYLENKNFTTVNNFEIQVVNGIIDQLQLDNRY